VRFVDANVVLRHLGKPVTPIDQVRQQASTQLFQRVRSGQEQVTTCEAVIGEVLYVLCSPRQYNLSHRDAATALGPVLRLRGLRVPQKRALLRALQHPPRRASSAAHSFGKYSSRSRNARRRPRVGQEHPEVAVLDPPGPAAVLPLHPDRLRPLLEEAGLVDDQHAVRIAELIDHVRSEIIAYGVRIPPRGVQQTLDSLRTGLAEVLGQLPPVLPLRSLQ
jgi:predicted nucleic acid-binding protein